MGSIDVEKTQPSAETPETEAKAGESSVYVDAEAEMSFVRKVDFFVLPLLCLSNLANAKTDGLEEDINLVGNEYSLLILLFYIPFGLFDLPWNLLIKRYSARTMLSLMTVVWGICAMCQCAAHNFGSLLAIRIILGVFEAGFFAGSTFYFTLFYTRGEMGFRLAILQSFAVLASAFSGLISFGLFQINHPTVKGWQWLFIVEGALTLIIGVIGFWWLPDNGQTAWFLNERERVAASARLLRDTSAEVETKLELKAAFQTWSDWKFPIWAVITFSYPVAYATAMNFFPIIVARLGYDTVKTNLWTVAPNLVGAVVLLAVAKSSDIFRERSLHIIFSLIVSLVGMLILASIDVANNKAVSYFACFLLAAGAYIPTCLVHAWHNNNNTNENSRAANTGFFVGLGNLAGILSAATFRTEYAPKYIPTLVATCACNGVCIVATSFMGVWMRVENRRRDRQQGVRIRAGEIETSLLVDGERSPEWRYFLLLKNMKKHACEYPGCDKAFTRAEHLRRHSLNHETANNGYTCQRCFTHFSRPDLLSRHMTRHAKKDAEAGGDGKGILETRKRMKRAEDGSIIVRPPKRQSRQRQTPLSYPQAVRPSDHGRGLVQQAPLSSSSHSTRSSPDHGPAPVSPPGSQDGPLSQVSTELTDPDPLLAPMMPPPFEPYVEPIPGQFDAADGSWSAGYDTDIFMDTATDFNLPFAATNNYNWLFDVASLDDAFHHLELPLGPDLVPFATEPDPMLNLDLDLDLNVPTDFDHGQDGSSVLLQAASIVERSSPEQRRPEFDLDWMGVPTIENNITTLKPQINDDARRGILTLVAQSPPVDIHGQPLNLDSPLLSLSALQSYSDLFFSRFNTTYPLIHTATFDPNTIEPVFLASILSMGATYSTREAHQLAVGIHDALRNQLFCHGAFSPQPELWVLQAMLLIDCFGKMRAGPKQRERAQLFHCVLIKLIRRSTCCSIRTSTATVDELATDTGRESAWKRAMDAEQRKRLAFQCFSWDTEHSVLFSQSLCMSAFEIRSSLPCSSAAWEAHTAEEWARHASRDTEHGFLPVLKGYITPGALPRPRDLNETPERVGAWTPRIGRAYDLWKADFDADCLAMKLGSPTPAEEAKRFTGLKSAAMALYRAASLALHVEVLDLQIAAGAPQILGRVVTDNDRSRSRNMLSQWLSGTGSSCTSASRHAAILLQDAVLSLHDWEQTDAFHFPWCLYLATLTVWAFHARNDGVARPTDLSSLIVAMTTSTSNGELGGLAGGYDTRPLVRAMAQQLATVRWAMVHDAMKVLVNLGV
ncbi:MFS transporter/fungal specific transcription factor domain-containing protein [Aspergillus undulatus]|uniref:MFS transporter/fungal specific transcription factor domain-containing protein n=1 Tax=Aspergillus undulatus TaxID=1810928 RepID=UPI003CCDB27F